LAALKCSSAAREWEEAKARAAGCWNLKPGILKTWKYAGDAAGFQNFSFPLSHGLSAVETWRTAMPSFFRFSVFRRPQPPG